MSIAIVFFSGTGTTARVAEAIAKGSGGTLLPIQGSQIIDGRFKDDAFLAKLDAAKAIVFGAATYMGGPAAQFKAFADATAGRWFGRAWSGKLAGGFTSSGSPSGDKLGTLQYLATLAMQHGMIWAGQDHIPAWMTGGSPDTGINPLGSHLGVMARQANQQGGAISPGDALTAETYGKRLAELAAKLAR